MIERSALLALNFYKKSPFTGSDGVKRYRVEKIELPTENEEAPEIKLQATVWPGPFAFANTSEGLKTTQLADFSEEGLQTLVDWINEQVV